LLSVSPKQDQNENIIIQLLNDKIDILYIIGGDGSMKAAHALWNYSQEVIKKPRFEGKKLSIVGIPKTMDNDILWVWQTFGFLSAVEKAREIIEQLSAEVISNPRICIVQLFGSDSGFVVSHAVVASKSTVCDAALIPEVPFTMKKLAKYLQDKIENDPQRKNTRIPMSLIVMAETAIPVDALDYIDDPEIDLTDEEKQVIRDFIEKKSINKKNDLLRTAGLKIVSRVLKQLLPNKEKANISWSRLRVFTNEPRHILRAISPSCSDTIMGNRLGTLAVDNALAGYTNFMISQWLTEFVLVPLELVVLGKKRIPTSGIFWKSVTTKTGQPDLGAEERTVKN
jgi:6-phosphofructokinase 1